MFSLPRNFYKIGLLRCFPNLYNIYEINVRNHPLCFYSVSSTSRTHRYSIHEVNAHLFTEFISEPANSEKLKIIVEEIQHTIESGKRFPEFINCDELTKLFDLESRNQRIKYLQFLFKREMLKLSDAKKKETKQRERELRAKEKVRNLDEYNVQYGLGRNSLLLSVRTRSMNKFYNKRLANAVLFGENIVLDLDYDKHMTEKEKSACITQLKFVYSCNRLNYNPYDMYFCNSNPSSNFIKYLKKDMPKIDESLLTLTDKNYLDIFPHEKLVYLSPHANETLKEYDHNAVYIIGAFVDTVKRKPISFNKAEKEGIKSYSLPLDDYIMWGAGTKSLTINQVFEIMLVLKNTGDWKKAFQVIPSRKIRKLDSEEQVRTQNVLNKIFLMNTSKNKVVV